MKSFSRNFWVYWTAGVVWSLGLMAYFLVYNLYLLDLGFNEAFVGRVSAAFTFGSLAATLPSGWLLTRLGIKRTIFSGAVLTGLTLLGRAILVSPVLLQCLAFANGASIGAWIVASPPFITQSTNSQVRSWAFSLWHGTSIGTGVLAGILVGFFSRHPGFLLGAGFSSEQVEKRALLFASSAIASSAIFVLFFLKEVPVNSHVFLTFGRQERGLPLTAQGRKFVGRMLIVLFLWSLFVGSFPPFFNVFFHTVFRQPLAGISWIFSLAQLCQVAAVFCMPLLVSRLGKSKAIPTTQFLSALVLPLLVVVPQTLWAGALYIVYLSFQVMTEPALENFIMDSVLEEERAIVSSFRYLTFFSVQAIAVWLTGLAISRVGYPVVLPIVASTGLGASICFYYLFHRKQDEPVTSSLNWAVPIQRSSPPSFDLPLERWDYLFLKRLLDISVATLLLVILSPVLILLALLVRLTTPGPVLFKQERVGLNGRTFWIFKFRTMIPSPLEVSDTWWTRPNDERVTTLGRFLRRTSLDELPQLFNVFRGDMSLVGPRPERPYYVARFMQNSPEYAKRLFIKCGITGWAQVHGWRGDTSIEKRIEYDLFYLQNWNLWLDIRILLLTLRHGFYNHNAY
jgi:lipopolysaccharide/colanic/teichoic acid biosynthesis glycosyltransferase